MLGFGDEPHPPVLQSPTYVGRGCARIEWFASPELGLEQERDEELKRNNAFDGGGVSGVDRVGADVSASAGAGTGAGVGDGNGDGSSGKAGRLPPLASSQASSCSYDHPGPGVTGQKSPPTTAAAAAAATAAAAAAAAEAAAAAAAAVAEAAATAEAEAVALVVLAAYMNPLRTKRLGISV